MRTRLKGVAVLLVLPFALLSLSRIATAQEYPPSTPTAGPTATPTVEVEVCVGIEGEVGDEFVAGQAEEQGQIRVFGSAGAAGDADPLSVYAEPGHVLLGSTQPFEDGSFSETFALPDSLEPGSYQVVTDSNSCSESAVLAVLSSSGESGTDVLGSSQSNSGDGTNVLGSASERGNLPTTGSNILDLVLLALALIAVGTAIRWLVKRRQSEGGVIGFSGKSWSVPALPPPSVPLIDTSDFVVFSPKRSAAIRSAKSKKADPEPHSDWS